jgi:predicted cytidylate kinase
MKIKTITLSGPPGSGTTTIAKMLENRLGIKHVYTGDIFRRLAEKYGMDLEEFGKYCEEHSEVDKALDEEQKKILEKGNVILEGRLAGWIAYKNKIPAIKIFLDADIDTRAKRVTKREGGEFEKRKQEILTREKSEAKRYKKYYGVNLEDKSIYDIVIDTSDKKPHEIVEIILNKL